MKQKITKWMEKKTGGIGNLSLIQMTSVSRRTFILTKKKKVNTEKMVIILNFYFPNVYLKKKMEV